MLNSSALEGPITSMSCNSGNVPIDPFLFQTYLDFLDSHRKFYRPCEMVVVFAHGHLFKDSSRHVLCVRKKPGSRHAGLLNLPGGKLVMSLRGTEGTLELPHIAALRELKEETNLNASQPQLIGCIVNGPMDSASPPFLVHVVRCIINPGQTDNVVAETDQPVSWELINQLSTRKFVPNLRFIIQLIAADLIGFVIQDSAWQMEFDDIGQERGNNFIANAVGTNQPTKSQAIITFLPLSISQTTPNQKPRRIET